jgi:threonine/homoserine/homoserine lactone efflux protein
MDRAAILDHEFLIAAYVVTWVIQLSYLAWLGLKWRAETRAARRRSTEGSANH